MYSKQAMNISMLILFFAFMVVPVCAQEPTPPPLDPNNWVTGFGGFEIGTYPGATDNFDGTGAWGDDPSGWTGVFTRAYYQYGVASGNLVWEGYTGFYLGDIRGPIAPGSSKTWSDIYLWDQNYALATPGQYTFGIWSDWSNTPRGYTAHIVLDQIPASANWTGPTEFTVDLSQTAGQYVFITLPIATVSNPLDALTQGTKMHITISAPVPEPSSVLVLAGGMIGMVGFALRRRREQ